MIKINLLASSSIKKEERKEILILAYVLSGIIVSIGLVKYGFNYHAYKLIQNKIAKTESHLGKYSSIVSQVDALQATKSVLQTKKNVIDSLMALRLVYPKLMEKLIALTPDNIWFDNLTCRQKGADILEIKLKARSLDIYSIAEFISGLSNSISFSEVELGPITTSESANVKVSNFDISFNFKIGAQK